MKHPNITCYITGICDITCYTWSFAAAAAVTALSRSLAGWGWAPPSLRVRLLRDSDSGGLWAFGYKLKPVGPQRTYGGAPARRPSRPGTRARTHWQAAAARRVSLQVESRRLLKHSDIWKVSSWYIPLLDGIYHEPIGIYHMVYTMIYTMVYTI
jgi:hypothetical protein